MGKEPPIHDEIGVWSEIKLEIVKEYATAYSTILASQTSPAFSHVYIDAFAGSGINVSRVTGKFVPGSPLNALEVRPPFQEFYLIDRDDEKVLALQKIVGARNDVHIFGGDCNEILLKKVFPQVKYSEFRRGLCFIDPYRINLDWNVILTAAQMKSVEIFLNFSTHYLNRAILTRRKPDTVPEEPLARMNAFWGDTSGENIAYRKPQTRVGSEDEKVTNLELALAYRERLIARAGFKYVPQPVPMKNSKGAVVYYLFFASHNPVAKTIVEQIFDKHRSRGY